MSHRSKIVIALCILLVIPGFALAQRIVAIADLHGDLGATRGV